MVKIIQRQDKELYQCKECGFNYEDKEWAEKCEAWCKEHHSCNIEITSHAVAVSKDEYTGNGNGKEAKKGNRLFTFLFYGLIGVVSSLAFALLLYWALLRDSNIASFLANTASEPVYQWLYGILSFAAIILFGTNVSFFVWRVRKFGFPKLWGQGSTVAGTLFGVLASACPVCGSTLLAVIGIAGGLAAFPFAGLELKALSAGLLALPIWLNWRDAKKLSSCTGGVCPVPRDASFRDTDTQWLYLLFGLLFLFSATFWNLLQGDPVLAKKNLPPTVSRVPELSVPEGTGGTTEGTGGTTEGTGGTSVNQDDLTAQITEKVLPSEGYRTKIILGDAVLKLVKYGVIDRQKFEQLYAGRGGLPEEFQKVFDEPLTTPITLTQKNAQVYVNLLWALGLSNYMETNKESPVNGPSLFNFASTGGWTLGKAKNGGEYFNKFAVVQLSPEQEALVTRIAQNTYRPCCNNSTFFQDCNHGSALLGLLQLGASQGLTEEELYREALTFNSFWFPQQYVEIALYFKTAQGIDWENVDPKVAMGKDYSTASGWYQNVHRYLQENNLVPKPQSGGGCGA